MRLPTRLHEAFGPVRRLAWAFLLSILLPAHAFFFVLAALAAALPLTPSRVAHSNARDRLGYGPARAYALTVAVFFNYYLYALESFLLRPLGLVRVEGLLSLERYMAAVRAKYAVPESVGNLMLGSHFGNIEVLGEAFAVSLARSHGGAYVALAKPAEARIITSFLDGYRRSRGIALLWTDRKDLLRALLDHARKGDSLGFLVDQKPASGGIFVRFFGAWAAFPFAGPDVGLRVGMPVFNITLVRSWPGFFRMEFAEGDNSHLHVAGELPADVQACGTQYTSGEIHSAGLSPKEARMAPVMAAFGGWLEAVVSTHPPQWFWDYRKWSRQPKAP